jgi:RNA polymerase sigma factor (sigma-70 family)
MVVKLTPEEIDAFKNGDTRVFRYLIDKYSLYILPIAFSILKIQQDAEEVAGDTFMALYNARKTIDSSEYIGYFLYNVVRNKSINLLKANKHRNSIITPTDPDSLEETSDGNNNTSILDQVNSQVTADEFNRQLRLELEKLAPRRQEACRLYYLEDWKVDDIARHMNIDTESVYTHIRKAREDLYKNLVKKYEKTRFYLPLLIFWLFLKLFY